MKTRTRRPGLNRILRSRLLACSLTLLLTACHGGGHSSSSQPPQQPGPSPITSSGGTVTSSDGKATVTIPSGALSQATVITAMAVTNVPAGNVGTAYEFGPSGTTFSQAVTIEITYDPALLPSGVTDADLVLAKIVNGQWEPIADSGVRGTTAGVVSGSTTSFSSYGLIPETPANLTAVPADSQVTLTWDPVPLAISYNVYWTTPTTTQQKISGVAPPTDVASPSYKHEGLVNGTAYTYQVSAQKPIGEGSLSEPPVAATPQAAGTFPAQPQNLSACAGDQQVQLSWDAASDATFYTLHWDTNADGTLTGSNLIPNIDTTVYVHANRTNGTTYEYFVEGINAVGAGPLSVPAVVEVTTLAPPQNLTAQPGSGNVTLSWDAVPCADSYTIHWEGGGSNDDIAIPDPTTVQYTQTGLQNGTTYNYVISTVNALGTGPASAQVSATPQAEPVPVLVSAGNASLHGLCVVYTDGSLRCRGVYPGDGTDYSATAATVPGISEATDVWVGDSHTCAVDGGQVKCWGADGVGQLGDRSTANSYVYTPVTVSGIENASQVVAGQAHTCAIDGGAVKCWGDGLGSGTFDTAIDDAPDTFGPFTVPLPAAAARLATGRLRELTCAALVNSETWCWGYDFGVGLDPDDCDAFGVNCAPSLATGLGPSRDYVTVGRTHACYLPVASESGVVCIGSGQAGTFEGLDPVIVFNTISSGEDFNCGIAPGSDAYCWGLNTQYQLGDGTNVEKPITTAVAVSGVNNATSISAAYGFACAIDDGVVRCWGQSGFTGGSFAPTAVDGF